MANGEPQPQFRTAEYTPKSPAMACAACRRPISGSYFKIKGAPVCAQCTEKIRARIPQDSHAAFVRAVIFGIGGALLGFALYVGFALATGLIIGFVSLAVGFIVGKAMQMGSGGVGGRRYQVVAVLLTYLSVSMSAVPIAIDQNRHHQTQAESTEASVQPGAHVNVGKAIGVLALIGIASPILELRDPVHGIIGLIILLVGIRFAWRFTADRTVNISGPFTVTAAGAG